MSDIITLFYIALMLNIPTIGLCALLSFTQKCEEGSDDGDNGEIKDPDPSLADENEGGGEVEIETPAEKGELNN